VHQREENVRRDIRLCIATPRSVEIFMPESIEKIKWDEILFLIFTATGEVPGIVRL